MWKLSEIKELIKLVDQTSVNELEIENEGSRILIRKNGKECLAAAAPVLPAAVPAASAQSEAPAQSGNREQEARAGQDKSANLHRIVSPMVGTFYQAPAPGAPPFVRVGDRVNEKTVVCIVEAMKLMNEIEAEVSGEIVEVLVENGQLVEYGQPLFLVKTD